MVLGRGWGRRHGGLGCRLGAGGGALTLRSRLGACGRAPGFRTRGCLGLRRGRRLGTRGCPGLRRGLRLGTRGCPGLRLGMRGCLGPGAGPAGAGGGLATDSTRAGRLSLRRWGRDRGRPPSTPGGCSSLIASHHRGMMAPRAQASAFRPDKRITSSAERPQVSVESKEIDRNFETYCAVLRIKLNSAAGVLLSTRKRPCSRGGVACQRVDFIKCSN